MTAISIRMDKLAAAHHQRAHRKGDHITQPIEDIRVMLEKVDGQAELGIRPGENIHTVMTRRLQPGDGWNLDLMPGETLEEKEHACDLVCAGKLTVSDEARHAARHVFSIYEPLY
jgi:hypothetical protein